MERDNFYKYLINRGYTHNTSYSYANSMQVISNHISELRRETIDLYQMVDIPMLEEIRDTYGLRGNYRKIGNQGRGTVRNGLNRYVEYRKSQNNEDQKTVVSTAKIKKERKKNTLEIEDYEPNKIEDISDMLVRLKVQVDEIKENTQNLTNKIIIAQIISLIIYIFLTVKLLNS